MTVATQTLEGQLDALIAEHGLTSLTLTRLRLNTGEIIWSNFASADGISGTNRGACTGSVEAELADALKHLDEKRARPVNVPELAPMEQAA